MNMINVIEKTTGTAYQAEKIEGGYKIFTAAGEFYKKVKDSTFKRYFKIQKDSSESTEPTQELSDEKREHMVEKIKKMLKLAENNPSLEEGLSAALQAQKLMVKYNIHEDEVTLEEIKDDIVSIFTTQKHNAHLLSWRKQLAVIVSRNFRCKCYISDGDVVFRGYKNDAQLALDVYMMLYRVGDKLGSKAYNTQKDETGSGKGAYNSFIAGFLKGVDDSLGEQCTALMVVTPKEVEDEWKDFSAKFTTQKTSLSVSDRALYNDGYAEGKTAVKSCSLENKGKKGGKK